MLAEKKYCFMAYNATIWDSDAITYVWRTVLMYQLKRNTQLAGYR